MSNEWILYNKHSPLNDDTVLVVTENKRYFVARYHNLTFYEVRVYPDDGSKAIPNVVAWMKIPEIVKPNISCDTCKYHYYVYGCELRCGYRGNDEYALCTPTSLDCWEE